MSLFWIIRLILVNSEKNMLYISKGKYNFSYEEHSEDVWLFKIDRKEGK